MINRSVLVLFSIIFLAGLDFAQDNLVTDSAIFLRKKQYFESLGLKSKPIGNCMAELAKSFIGCKYRSHTLEQDGEESLVINLREFDCTTFVEEMIALARTFKAGGDFQDFKKRVTSIRYRDGKLNGYCSRLHYFSEWSQDNAAKGFVKNITEQFGGVTRELNLNFMSTHPAAYSKLSGNIARIDSIRILENKISGQKFYYIPKANVSKIEKDLHDGDIVGFTTGVPGLDIGHVALIVSGVDGRKYLIHAPQEGSTVMITKPSLGDYVRSVKKHTGVIILRPVE